MSTQYEYEWRLDLTVISPTGEQWTMFDCLRPSFVKMIEWVIVNELPGAVAKCLDKLLRDNKAPAVGQTAECKMEGWTVKITGVQR